MTLPALDQGFKSYKASLLTTAAPFNPRTGSGANDDDARYVARPGLDFLRPWIAIRNGIAYQFPLGLEGFDLNTDPVLGIHRLIGDNAVEIDVIHTGEEHITLMGNFPGDSAPANVQALREIVRRGSDEGKILYVPEIFTRAQLVQVVNSRFNRAIDDRGRDTQYSVEFAITGLAGKTGSPQFTTDPVSTTAANKGVSPRVVRVDGSHNTLRKIASWKLGVANKWKTLYDLNELWFVQQGISVSKAGDYRLPPGVAIYF